MDQRLLAEVMEQTMHVPIAMWVVLAALGCFHSLEKVLFFTF